MGLSEFSTTVDSEPVSELYQVLGRLRDKIDGPYRLADLDGTFDWPERGIYWFFSPESSLSSGSVADNRLTRIGTVGVSEGSSNTLWNRLRQHRGNKRGKYSGGGNHRGSILRLHVGAALIEKHDWYDEYPHWGEPNPDAPTTEVREQEHELEQKVTEYIEALPFLYVNVSGEPGPESDRATIEASTIAMVSHYRRTANPADLDWLGYHSPKPEIYRSGLWNIQHISELFDPSVISLLDEYVDETSPIE
ncbi:hypothetical protein [Haloarcula sp. 1CSR25-25]|jgi:hypothetical protein|uniref:hypothetical protein n=1 Tax=Haloarcula sp. 1CSR25-25 TaxID=2862545 RepID=UPI002898DD1B|nr:hypothetical protein [Haloarcula sp. 1CSR25-25]